MYPTLLLPFLPFALAQSTPSPSFCQSYFNNTFYQDYCCTSLLATGPRAPCAEPVKVGSVVECEVDAQPGTGGWSCCIKEEPGMEREYVCAENGFLDKVGGGGVEAVVFMGTMGILEGVFHRVEGEEKEGMEK